MPAEIAERYFKHVEKGLWASREVGTTALTTASFEVVVKKGRWRLHLKWEVFLSVLKDCLSLSGCIYFLCWSDKLSWFAFVWVFGGLGFWFSSPDSQSLFVNRNRDLTLELETLKLILAWDKASIQTHKTWLAFLVWFFLYFTLWEKAAFEK